MSKKEIDVCLTPLLYHHHIKKHTVVVVLDTIRASTTIATALHYGMRKVIPVSTPKEALEYQNKKNHVIAGERDSHKIEGFDLGNSPFDYMGKNTSGKTLVFTTTNGTEVLNIASEVKPAAIAMGSFVNFDVLIDWILKQNKDVLLLCSGWKNQVNIEDTICAGKIAQHLVDTENYQMQKDSAQIAAYVYQKSQDSLFNTIMEASPRLRSKLHYLVEDIRFCLTENSVPVVPVMKSNALIAAK